MRAHVSFKELFNDWLEACLAERVPENVRALSFSINQRELCFRVELNGTSEFNRYGTAWTWSECWSPVTAKLRVPTIVCRGVLGNCSHAVTSELLRYLRGGALRQKLSRYEGIAVESIDGEYELVWLNQGKSMKKNMRKRPI